MCYSTRKLELVSDILQLIVGTAKSYTNVKISQLSENFALRKRLATEGKFTLRKQLL